MPRLCPIVPPRASLALALLAVLAAAGAGQSQGLVDDLELRPSLSPQAKGGQRQASFGSPPGSGAGQTGFVSTNAPAAGAKQPAPRPPEAALKGNPAQRLQQELSQTGSLETQRRRRPPEEYPYAPVGLRAGSFDVRPSLQIRGGYDDNPFRVSEGRKPSTFTEIEGRIEAQSNWSRHSLYGELRGTYTDYLQVDGNDRPEAEAILRGRIDVSSLSRIELEGRAALTTDDPGTPDAITSARRPPHIYTFGARAGYVQQLNRLELGLRGTVQRSLYQDAELLSGGTLDRSDRNFTSYGVELRAGYETLPGVEPFLEARMDRRVFDQRVDFDGIRRGSDGMELRGGIEFARERIVSGEASAGYAWRRYEDPSLRNIGGLVFDASLVWHASALTKISLVGNSEIGETTLLGASGVFHRRAGVIIEHAFRRWLIGSAGVHYAVDDYRGAGRRDERLTLRAGLTYHLNRYAALEGEIRHERQRSDDPSGEYDAGIFMLGLRLQR